MIARIRAFRLGRAAGYWTAVLVALLALWTSGAPSTSYPLYEEAWRLQPLVITEVFGAYPLALVITLLLTGNLSDHIGRRVTMLLGVAGMLVGTVCFAVATDITALFIGRILMGVGVGLALAPASASVVEHSKPGRRGSAAAVTTAATAIGVVFSTVIGGALVEYGPLPLQLDYWVLTAVLTVALVLTVLLPQESPPNGARRWCPELNLRSASGHGRPLIGASLSAALAYMTGGIFLALGASIARDIIHTSNSLTIGLLLALPFATVGALGVFFRQVPAHVSIRIGAVAAVASFAMLLATAVTGSLLMFILTALAAGVTYAFAFAGGLGYVNVHYPSSHRGAALSTLYLIAYAGQGGIAVLLGLIATTSTLTLAVAVGCAVMVCVAIATLTLSPSNGANPSQEPPVAPPRRGHLEPLLKGSTMNTPFAPDDFALVPARTFEQLEIGEVFRAPSRTLSDAHASAFQAVSADNHPVHYDAVWATRHGHDAPVVHGLQVLAFTAPGATLFPHVIGEVFIAFTGLTAEFLGEVHAGDTLYPQLTIAGLEPAETTGTVTTEATVHNQRGELVLRGTHTYLLKLTPTA
jgi:MFS family permease